MSNQHLEAVSFRPTYFFPPNSSLVGRNELLLLTPPKGFFGGRSETAPDSL